ncbi:peptidylprolyl isomerase [Undibacterium jejuense]|uniref:peptidylprolyl isomerase n=1 Tax=Undibacterium jejuense TaxID=1344949 RepID=A0A923HCT8_9BURK|nr:peptidylprolyl isomerase [Undibacterium jejuense]MBC3861631.1 peptidylprolyl isomerase [Undibacterium jejuense]
MKASTWLLGAFASLVFLSGCGGSKSSNNAVLATVSSVSISPTLNTSPTVLKYRQAITMVINGQNLQQGVNINNPGCANLTESAGGSNTTRTFTCKIIHVGPFNMTITDTANNQLYFAAMSVPLAARPQVTLATTMGNIVVELNPFAAPISVDNFLNYVESGFYSNTIFHRADKQVIQAGGYTPTLTALTPTNPAITLESTLATGLSNTAGTIGMASTSVANSATSQFYFNVVDNSSIFNATTTSGGYAVFGTIFSGLNVMQAIDAVPTSAQGGLPTVPVTPVIITSATRTQ